MVLSFNNSNSCAKGLKIAHFNVRSFLPKVDSIKLWLLGQDLDVATFSESWLNSSIQTSLLALDSYDVIRLDRSTGHRGGGLLTLINKNKKIICDPLKLTHLNISNKNAEIQVLQIKPGHIKKMVILNCYRPPSGNIDAFMDHIYNILDQINKLNEYKIYVCGDFNIDYGQPNLPGFKKLKAFQSKYGLMQLINCPTRVTASTNSILDLIFTNCKAIKQAAPQEINISDHEPVIAVRKSTRIKHPRVSFTCRSFTNYVKEEFQLDLESHDWSKFYEQEDVNIMWAEMERIILHFANLHCPYKVYNDRVELAPWLSQDLLELIKDRDRLYKLAKSTGSNDDWATARRARNKSNHGIKHAKEEYVKQQLDVHEKNPRKFWQTLNAVISPTDSSSCHINLVDPSSGELLNDADIPEVFNSHLCGVGRRLSEKFKDNARNSPTRLV